MVESIGHEVPDALWGELGYGEGRASEEIRVVSNDSRFDCTKLVCILLARALSSKVQTQLRSTAL